MFKQWIVALLFLMPFWVVQANAQSRGSAAAPVSLERVFDDHFPGASSAFWEKGPDGYTVSFKEKGLEMTAHYNLSEIWQYTDIILPRASVPAAVLKDFNQRFGSPPILAMGYHDSPAKRYFKLEAEIDRKRQTAKYNDEGVFIGKE